MDSMAMDVSRDPPQDGILRMDEAAIRGNPGLPANPGQCHHEGIGMLAC